MARPQHTGRLHGHTPIVEGGSPAAQWHSPSSTRPPARNQLLTETTRPIHSAAGAGPREAAATLAQPSAPRGAIAARHAPADAPDAARQWEVNRKKCLNPCRQPPRPPTHTSHVPCAEGSLLCRDGGQVWPKERGVWRHGWPRLNAVIQPGASSTTGCVELPKLPRRTVRAPWQRLRQQAAWHRRRCWQASCCCDSPPGCGAASHYRWNHHQVPRRCSAAN